MFSPDATLPASPGATLPASPGATLSASTDQLLDGGRMSRNLSVVSVEYGDVSSQQKFSMSVIHVYNLFIKKTFAKPDECWPAWL